MMNRIDQKFQDLAKQGRKALFAYVTGGFPSMAALSGIVRELELAGVDILEIGVPFSDPIADGPTIQYSSQKALELGANLPALLTWIAKFRKKSSLPLVLMSYLNPLNAFGFGRFSAQAKIAGVDGVVVPDVIPEEADFLRSRLTSAGIHLVHLAAPTTLIPRRKMIAQKTRGFLYAVSVAGVTGARRQLPKDTILFLRELRKVSPVPVAVGFGISTPQMARQVAPHADGIIVGSALIDRIRHRQPLGPFVKSLRRALDAG